MKRYASTLILALTLFGAASADAQAPTRLRGSVTGIAGDVMSVKSIDGSDARVTLTDKTAYVFMQPIALAEIKQGDFLAITSRKRPDGSLLATDVRRFAKPVNPGHRPLDGREDQTMTNARVEATVQSTSGHELLMSYDGGSQKIIVPDNASISTLVPGTRAQLVPGAVVNVNASSGAEGTLVAQSIQFSTPRR